MSSLNVIFAMSKNGVIGDQDTIPWCIPEDLKMFSNLTNGKIVVMGRETWVSLPPRYRPLPNRRNIVLSATPGYTAEGAEVFDSFEKVLELSEKHPGEVWVIGGKKPIELAMPHAQRLVLTYIQKDYTGDRKAPDIFIGDSITPKDGVFSHVLMDQHASNGIKYKVFNFHRRITHGSAT
jgi:dihydrofolate reductase